MDFRTRYFAIWTAAWSLHKKYYNIRASDEAAWKQLNDECEQLDQQYRNKPERKFIQSLLLGVVAELEREARNAEATGTATTTQP